MAEGAHSPIAPAFIEPSILERLKSIAYSGPLLCAWIRFIHRHAKEERAGKGQWVADRKQPEGADLGDCRQATRAVRGSVRQRVVSGVASALQRYTVLLPFASLCFILPAFLVEQSSLFLSLPLFLLPLHPPVAQSYPASRLKSTSLCVPVATFRPHRSLPPHHSF